MKRLTQKETELIKQAIKFTDPCVMCHITQLSSTGSCCENCVQRLQYQRMVGTCIKMNLFEYVQTIQSLQVTQREVIRKTQCLPAEIRNLVKIS